MFCKDLCSVFQNNYFLEHPWLAGLNNLYQSIYLSIYLLHFIVRLSHPWSGQSLSKEIFLLSNKKNICI